MPRLCPAATVRALRDAARIVGGSAFIRVKGAMDFFAGYGCQAKGGKGAMDFLPLAGTRPFINRHTMVRDDTLFATCQHKGVAHKFRVCRLPKCNPPLGFIIAICFAATLTHNRLQLQCLP